MGRKEEKPSPFESRLLRPKLIQAVAADFPFASETLLEFPDEWMLTAHLDGNPPLYIGGWTEEERVRSDHFHGLPREVNEGLNRYSLFKFFRPWRMPTLQISWDETPGRGQVIKPKDIKIQMQPIGQAQVRHGGEYAVLWESYFYAVGQEQAGWEDRLAQIWQKVEEDFGAKVFYTLRHEPAWPEGKTSYQGFLRRLGYGPSLESTGWWGKGK